MNIEDWDIFLKYKNKNQMLSNSVYVPYVNKEKKVFCMDYNYNSKYFFDRPDYTQSKMDFYLQNEIKFLKHLANETFCPEVLDIDIIKKRIFFKWYDTSLNHLINENLFKEQYAEQATSILSRLEKLGIYKINFYPHTCYLCNDELKIHDLYGCVSSTTHYLPMEILEPVLSYLDRHKFKTFENDGLVDMKKVYYFMLRSNPGQWPNPITRNNNEMSNYGI
jgi:hypothetical protein